MCRDLCFLSVWVLVYTVWFNFCLRIFVLLNNILEGLLCFDSLGIVFLGLITYYCLFLVYCCTPSTFFYDYCFHVVLLPVLFWQSFVAFALYLVSTKSLNFVNYVPIYHHYCCCCLLLLKSYLSFTLFCLWILLLGLFLHHITTHFLSLVIPDQAECSPFASIYH